MEHKYSTYALVFFGVLLFGTMITALLTSGDIDEICNADNMTLYRWQGEWICGNISSSEGMSLGDFAIQNTSLNNYILYVNSTNGEGGESYIPPFTEWINSSTTLQTSTSLVPVYITSLNASLLPNSYYNFNCGITYASNVTTNGIRIGLMTLTNPPDMTFNIKIPQAGAGTDSFMEWQGDAWRLNVTSTGVISTAVNYTVIIEGDIYTNGNQNWMTPYFGAENATRTINVTRAYCRWTKII